MLDKNICCRMRIKVFFSYGDYAIVPINSSRLDINLDLKDDSISTDSGWCDSANNCRVPLCMTEGVIRFVNKRFHTNRLYRQRF